MSTPFIHLVAEAYDKAPVCHPPDVRAWEALAAETMATADKLRACLAVSYTPKAEPYATAYDMLVDIARGRLVVSTAHCHHPVWTLEENAAFRLVHDVVGHGTTGSGFDWRGEWRAYEAHLAIVQSPLARHALFTEAVGQAAWAIVNGGYQGHVQKVALLPQYLQWGADAWGGCELHVPEAA
jgi:hypothetical protein